MRCVRAILYGVMLVAATGPLSVPTGAELQWQEPKMEPVRVRIVALAWNHHPTSFFANEEVFIADMQIAKDESRLVKLVYSFLPYQPRLSDNGLDYSIVHELQAARDPDCDQTVSEITTGRVGDWRQDQSQLKYSTDAPAVNLERHKKRLPCYVTSAADYTRPVHQSAND